MHLPRTAESDRVRPRICRRVFMRALAAGGSLPVLASWIACTGESSQPSEHGGPSDAAVELPAALALPFLTPLDAFFVQAGGRATVDGWSMPQLDGDTHRIAISGLVERELEFGLRDLEADAPNHVTVVKTMMCVLGYRACALWTGVALRGWLERAGVLAERAQRVRFFGADGFENNLKWSDIQDSPNDMFEPLLAFRMGDQPLPVEHGYPVRLLLADRFGYKNIKWLARIEVSDRDLETGQYQQHGYPDSGLIAPPVPSVESHRISQDIPVGTCEVVGYALSGAGAISAVEVDLDGHGFDAAALIPTEHWRALYPELDRALQAQQPQRFGAQWRGVWVVWRFRFDAVSGEHTLAVRARDTSGQVGTATTLHLRAV